MIRTYNQIFKLVEILRLFLQKKTLIQKIKFSIKDFFSKCDQIRSFLWIWSHFFEKIVNGKLHFLCRASPALITLQIETSLMNKEISKTTKKKVSVSISQKKNEQNHETDIQTL